MFSKIFKSLSQPKPTTQAENKDQPKRHNDAVLIVRQDNGGKKLLIEGTNGLAQKLLGFEKEELFEKDLREFLPESVNEIINDNIEFEDIGKGLDEVLNRLSAFKLKARNGTEIPLKIKAVRSLSSSANSRFQLVMNDSSLVESLNAHRENYRAKMTNAEIFDAKTHLLSRKSIEHDIEFIAVYGDRNNRQSCYAVFKFINYNELERMKGQQWAEKKFMELVEAIQSTRRDSDIAGLIAHDAIVLILPETPKENIKIPVSRIHGKLSQDLKPEVRIYYNCIKPEQSAHDQLNNCMKGMAGTF